MADNRRIFSAVQTVRDPRQGFRAFVVQSTAEFASAPDTKNVFTIPMDGFPAMCVDLGWIQDHVRRFVRNHLPTFDELVALLDEELPQVVQRVKEVSSPWPLKPSR